MMFTDMIARAIPPRMAARMSKIETIDCPRLKSEGIVVLGSITFDFVSAGADVDVGEGVDGCLMEPHRSHLVLPNRSTRYLCDQ